MMDDVIKEFIANFETWTSKSFYVDDNPVKPSLPPPANADDIEVARCAVVASGLSQTEMAAILGMEPQSLRQKLIGRRPLLWPEFQKILETWQRVEDGETDGMPDGAVRQAAALKSLRRRRRKR